MAIASVAVLAGQRFMPQSNDGGLNLTDATVCTTCISVSAPSNGPVLYPGAKPDGDLPITINNLTNGPVYVTSVAVAFTNTFPTGCPASEFSLNGQSFVGGASTITLSPAVTLAAGGSYVFQGALGLPDNGSNQNACAGLPLNMTYTGTANYTLMTGTTLSTSVNSSGDSASLNATVAPDVMPASAGHTPGSGDGSVAFYQCTATDTSTCSTLLGSAPLNSSGQATYTVSASTVGSFRYQAVFSPADPTNFVTSTSTVATQSLSGCVAVPTTAATTMLTGTTSGNYEVKPGTSVWLNGGTITGNVTVDAGGAFAATGATILGNVQSSGGPIAMSGTTVKGNVQSTGGGLSLGPTTSVGGNAQVQGGGPFCSDGSSTAPVQVKGNLLGQSMTSSTTSSVCSTNVGNNLQWQSNSSPSVIGTCGTNTVLGNLIVQSNSGNLTIGGSGGVTTTTGNITVQSNTGGGTLTGNKAAGNCLLSSNKPGIVGTGNTTGKGNNQCNTGAGGA